METHNERSIENKFKDYAKANTNFEELSKKAANIMIKDYKNFVSEISDTETKAISSNRKEDFTDIGCFEGSGSYLTLYIRLLTLCKKLKSFNAGGNQDVNEAFKMLLECKVFDEKIVEHKAEKSYEKLASIVESIEKNAKKIQISYYMGAASIYLNGCILSYYKNDAKGFDNNLQALLSYKSIIQKNLDNYYKEILYGVSGYLYCLLELQKLLRNEKAESEFYVNLSKDVRDLVALIVDAGIKSYGHKIDINKLPNDFRLAYDFHKKEYFGGAHGLFGVLYMLLKAYQLNSDFLASENSDFTNKFLACVKASLNYLLQFQTNTGNFPTRARKDQVADMVQFCHGSPGAVPCLLLASEVFKKESVGENCFKSALLAGDNIWKYGILKKGYGLCHGISGNAYSFLALYRSTNDLKWLYRALCFLLTKEEKYYQDKIKSYDFEDRYLPGTSDYPYSLMQGLAGDIRFEADCFFPKDARFPGYEV